MWQTLDDTSENSIPTVHCEGSNYKHASDPHFTGFAMVTLGIATPSPAVKVKVSKSSPLSPGERDTDRVKNKGIGSG